MINRWGNICCGRENLESLLMRTRVTIPRWPFVGVLRGITPKIPPRKCLITWIHLNPIAALLFLNPLILIIFIVTWWPERYELESKLMMEHRRLHHCYCTYQREHMKVSKSQCHTSFRFFGVGISEDVEKFSAPSWVEWKVSWQLTRKRQILFSEGKESMQLAVYKNVQDIDERWQWWDYWGAYVKFSLLSHWMDKQNKATKSHMGVWYIAYRAEIRTDISQGEKSGKTDIRVSTCTGRSRTKKSLVFGFPSDRKTIRVIGARELVIDSAHTPTL